MYILFYHLTHLAQLTSQQTIFKMNSGSYKYEYEYEYEYECEYYSTNPRFGEWKITKCQISP